MVVTIFCIVLLFWLNDNVVSDLSNVDRWKKLMNTSQWS